MQKYHYYYNCVSPDDYNELTNFIDNAKEIKYQTFIKNVDKYELHKLFRHIYDGKLKIQNDWHIRFYKSKSDNIKCYYVQHSGIEYIFKTT